MLLFGVMTLIDTKFFYFEQEELVEINEIEDEELEKSNKENNWVKLPIIGGTDFVSEQLCYQIQHLTRLCVIDFDQYDKTHSLSHIPLFLMHCCLKIPFL